MGSRFSRLTQVSYTPSEDVNASEALLLETIGKVKREEIEYLEIYQTLDGIRDAYNDLQEILHILRGNDRLKGEGRLVLNYDVCDVVELAQDLIDSYKDTDEFRSATGPGIHILRCIRAVKTRMLSSESGIRSEDIVEETDIFVGEDVVGLGGEIEQLLGRVIFYDDRVLFKLTVEGMAGVGKTALVRKLYNHPRVVDKFECRAWLRVPSDFSHKGVLMNLIQQVVDSDDDDERRSLVETMMYADVPTLQKMLHRHLLGRLYLIVIDDVPEEMDLNMIYKGLPSKDKGSRLLLTSRFENMQAIAAQYKMKTLNSDTSWELFMKTVFGGNKFTSDHDEFPKHLERTAKEMLTSKCGGVPSAIKNVGMQVARMRESGSEWEQLLEWIDFDETLDLLEESYRKLDPDTKSCFMYMACFKENITMRIDKLEHILEAAGVVDLEHGARSCVIALVLQFFLEAKETRMDGIQKSCGMNAMLHRLSIKKAEEEEEEIGFEIICNNGNARRCQSPRHRVIKCSREKFDNSSKRNKCIVSLFFHGSGSYLDARPSYWKSFEKLKILHLEDFGLKLLPRSIGLLSELTYLGLRNNYIRALPHSLGRLKKLEVLDITQNFMVKVPDIIWEMDSLLHLYMSDVICPEPLRIDAQWSLITLTYISIDNWTCVVSGSEEATGLKKLGIEGLDANSDISKLFASLAKLEYLHRLILKGFRYKRMPCLDELGTLKSVSAIKLDGLLERLPRSFPTNICSLRLANTCLDEDPMPVLAKLRDLTYLKLENAYNGQEMEMLDGEFPQLCILRIIDLRYLRNLRVGKGAMARLTELEINKCPYLETLPEELRVMARLRELKMVTTKKIENKTRGLGVYLQNSSSAV